MATEALVGACSLLTVGLAAHCFVLLRRHNELAARLRGIAIYHAEAARFLEARARLSEAQQLAEAAVDGGTEVVRTIHHGIASIPFTILESIPVTRDTTRLVHGIHDLTADSVYGAISTINRVLGSQLRRGLKPNGATTPARDRKKP